MVEFLLAAAVAVEVAVIVEGAGAVAVESPWGGVRAAKIARVQHRPTHTTTHVFTRAWGTTTNVWRAKP